MQFVAVDMESGVCSYVARPWTLPLMQADNSGNWQGELNFNPQQAMYHFNIFSFVGDMSVYSDLIGRFERDIDRIAAEGLQNDLAINLLYWASWVDNENVVLPNGKTTVQSMSFAADAISICWTDVISGARACIHMYVTFDVCTSCVCVCTFQARCLTRFPTARRAPV